MRGLRLAPPLCPLQRKLRNSLEKGLSCFPQPEALPVDRRVSEDPLRRCCHKEPRFLNTCLHTSTFEQQRCHQLHIDKRSTIAPFSSHLNGSLNFAAAQTRPLIVFRRYAAANLPTPYGIIVQRICQTRIPMAVCRG